MGALLMRVGLIARSEDRGLGHMTWSFYEHVQPERTLLIDMGPFARGFAQHHERYPDATRIDYNDGALDERTVRRWLNGLDVLYSAETFYDPRMIGWARDAGVRTVLHVMPEFWRWDMPLPDVLWLPTRWRRTEFVQQTRIVPVPITRSSPIVNRESNVLRVLHIAGNRAAGDRNGTILAMNALRYISESMIVRVETQGQRLPSLSTPRHVELHRHAGGRADRWSMYDDADVLLLPRRYGGLCLPALEAMASGLAVMMPQAMPNIDWPIVPLRCVPRGTLEAPAGMIEMVQCAPRTIAAALDSLAADPIELAAAQLASMRWAIRNDWESLLPQYEYELTRACERVTW